MAYSLPLATQFPPYTMLKSMLTNVGDIIDYIASPVLDDRSRRRLRLILFLCVTGGASWLTFQLARQRKLRDPTSILNMFGPVDSLRSILMAMRTKHVRNLIMLSAVLAILSREAGRRVLWMPRILRRRTTGLFSFFFVSLWFLYYHFRVKERPVIHYRRSMWNVAIMERFQVEKFRPVFWAFNSHAQTVLCNSLNKLDEVLKPFSGFERQKIPAFDKVNYVVLDWAKDAVTDALPEDAPVALICHGIMGSAEDNYCRNIVSLCRERGWRAVVHDRWRLDFGEFRDIHTACNAIADRFPRAPVLAISFSAGAHVLLSYLIEYGKNTPLIGAVAVSPALDLVKMINQLERVNNITYRLAMEFSVRSCVMRHLANDNSSDKPRLEMLLERQNEVGCHEMYDTFLANLSTFSGQSDIQHSNNASRNNVKNGLAHSNKMNQSQLRTNHVSNADDSDSVQSAHVSAENHSPRSKKKRLSSLPFLLSRMKVERPKRIASRDQIAPLAEHQYSPFGNPTAPHYRRTVANNLDRIAVPTLVLISEDDPLLPPSFCSILRQASLDNKCIVFAATKTGGHCAWHEGIYPAGPSYAERLAVHYLAAVLSAHSHTTFVLDVVSRAAPYLMHSMNAMPQNTNDETTRDERAFMGNSMIDSNVQPPYQAAINTATDVTSSALDEDASHDAGSQSTLSGVPVSPVTPLEQTHSDIDSFTSPAHISSVLKQVTEPAPLSTTKVPAHRASTQGNKGNSRVSFADSRRWVDLPYEGVSSLRPAAVARIVSASDVRSFEPDSDASNSASSQ